MRAIKVLLFGGIGLALVFLAAAYFVPSLRVGPVKKWFRTAEGFTEAKTPNEALDKFRDAIKKRDYETAATYCGGDYAEQMVKGSVGAKKLGTAIDELLDNMETTGVKSDKTKVMLKLLEPFPTDFKVLNVKTEGDDKAFAYLAGADEKPLNLDFVTSESWRIDPKMLLTLVPIESSNRVELRREGQGDKKSWKIFFPVTPRLRESVDKLKDNHSNYVRAIDKVKYEIKHDAATKSDVERRLRTELEEAK